MFYKIIRSSFILLLLSTPNLAKSTEEVFDIKARHVLSGSPVSVEEVFSTSRRVVRRRGDSLCWQMTKFFGAAYLAVMGSGESSSSRSVITRSEGNNLDPLTDVPEGVAPSWGLLPVAYAVETRRDEIVYDWSTPEETTTPESVFLSLRGNKHHKHAHQLVLLPEKSESIPSLGKKGVSETREELDIDTMSMRFAKAKDWGHARAHVLAEPDEAAAIVQFGVENGNWFAMAMAADDRGGRAKAVFDYLDQRAPIGWQKLRAEVAHWAIPIMVAGNFQAYGTPEAVNPIPLRIHQARHMRDNLIDESVCATPPCVGFEFEIPTFTMVYHQTDRQHHIPKESKVGFLYDHDGKFKYVGELGGTLEVVTFPLSTADNSIRDSAHRLSNRLGTLFKAIFLKSKDNTEANIRINKEEEEKISTKFYSDTAFMETELIHKMRPNVLFPFGYTPVDSIRFGLDHSKNRRRLFASEKHRFYFNFHPHVTLGVKPEKLSKFLYLTIHPRHEKRYDQLFYPMYKNIVNAARLKLKLGRDSDEICEKDSAGSGLAWLIGTYLETYAKNEGKAFRNEDPKMHLPIMARTNFRALADATRTNDKDWYAFIRCLGNYLSNATPRYFEEGVDGEVRLTELFGLGSIEDARQSDILGGHRVFEGTTYTSEREDPGTDSLRDLYGYVEGNCAGPTVESWLYSIRHNIGGDVTDYAGKDLLSPPTCFNLHDTHPEGMGSMGMKDALAILELRMVIDPCYDHDGKKPVCKIRELTGIISTTEGLKQKDDGKIEFFMERFKDLSIKAHT